MDYKLIENKVYLQEKITELCDGYRSDLIQMTNDANRYKKAALLYYGLRDFRNCLHREERFNPSYMPHFYRGNIVSVNFGFNVGAELGGKHYAIVLKDSTVKNPMLNVLPLSSIKATKTIDDLRPGEIYIGSEIFQLINSKCQSLAIAAKNEIATLTKILNSLNGMADSATEKIICDKLNKLEDDIQIIKRTKNELAGLKQGSYAKLDQIRTISKMRIIQPINPHSAISGIRISKKVMDVLSDAIIDYYKLKID